ncbi:hypothetical protein BGLA2_850005 [Burkholderia gladioli]|nr:hypothetical protein BGLA2_850005 [Burkholderia gladioli]
MVARRALDTAPASRGLRLDKPVHLRHTSKEKSPFPAPSAGLHRIAKSQGASPPGRYRS